MHPVERCVRACAEPAWRLAHALLRDPHDAFDAVQQAFLVAARKPGAVPEGDPWPWMRAVVAHEARNLRRKRRPATNVLGPGPEGGEMDAPDPRAQEPSRAAVRDEEAALLWQAVDRLPEAEREAVLLTHLGGLTHAATAQVLGVPRQTVTERARRGLETLAARLRRDVGAATSALAALPVLAPPQGLRRATAAWVEGAMGAAASGAAGVTTGGGVMAASKAAWVAGVAVAAGVGFLGGAATEGAGIFDGRADATVAAPGVAEAEPPRPGAASVASAGLAVPGAAEEAQRLRSDNERLAARVAALERDLASRAPAAGGRKGPFFTFGEMGRLEAVRDADWAMLGSASRAVSDAILEIFRKTEAGEPVPKETHVRLQENVERVRTYEYRTVDRMPTAAKHNGELTHPISATNLLAAVLEQGGRPLSPEQVAEFDRLGAAFDEEFSRARARWGPSVPRARRLLEEMGVKGRLMDGLWAALTPEQRPLWVDPAFRGVAGIDLFDPTLLVIHTSPVVAGATLAEVRAKLAKVLRPKAGLEDGAGDPRFDAALDAFLARAGRALQPVPRVRVRHYTYAEAMVAGEATAELVDALLRDIDLTPEARQALLDDFSWYVPRLVAP